MSVLHVTRFTLVSRKLLIRVVESIASTSVLARPRSNWLITKYKKKAAVDDCGFFLSYLSLGLGVVYTVLDASLCRLNSEQVQYGLKDSSEVLDERNLVIY